jgi:hypothetical protein
MPTEASKPASDRQIAYIKSLKAELGGEGSEINHEMTSFEASQLIGELIAKGQKNGRANGKGTRPRINEPRLGMAMKECFRLWVKLGRSAYDERRQLFIKDAIDTYSLFTEIAEQVEQGACERR